MENLEESGKNHHLFMIIRRLIRLRNDLGDVELNKAAVATFSRVVDVFVDKFETRVKPPTNPNPESDEPKPTHQDKEHVKAILEEWWVSGDVTKGVTDNNNNNNNVTTKKRVIIDDDDDDEIKEVVSKLASKRHAITDEDNVDKRKRLRQALITENHESEDEAEEDSTSDSDSDDDDDSFVVSDHDSIPGSSSDEEEDGDDDDDEDDEDYEPFSDNVVQSIASGPLTLKTFETCIMGKKFEDIITSNVYKRSIKSIAETLLSNIGDQSRKKCSAFQKEFMRYMEDPHTNISRIGMSKQGTCDCCQSTRRLTEYWQINEGVPTWNLGADCCSRLIAIAHIYHVLREVANPSLDMGIFDCENYNSSKEAYSSTSRVLLNAPKAQHATAKKYKKRKSTRR